MTEQPNTNGTADPHALQQALADALNDKDLLAGPAVEAAFRSVPRHLFLPDVPLQQAYADEAIVTKRENNIPVSSSSQPSMMAIMLEQLGLRPGDRVLEIGTATGYNAAIMAHIVGGGGHVVTIDIDEDLTEGARRHLDAAGYGNVEVVCADGAFGFPEGAPFDRIIVTVGTWDIPPAWLEQLAPDGRLVLPIAVIGDIQESVALEWRGDRLVAVSHKGCGFVHMRGTFTSPERTDLQIGPDPNLRLHLSAGNTLPLSAEAIYAMLREPHRDFDSGVRVTEHQVFGRVVRWLDVALENLYTASAGGPLADDDVLPYLFGQAGSMRVTVAVLAERGMAFLMRPPGTPMATGQPERGDPVDLWVRGFGDDDSPARAMVDEIVKWDRMGRPSALELLDIEAYPDRNAYVPEPGDTVVDKEHIRLVLKPRS